ncbi:MAG: protein kinase [Planctomycetota bacterium]
MREPTQSPVSASDDLVRRLTELQLCRPQDFQRAKGYVRRLAYDLPAFDSVWIDALVQLRRLTPYQARVLEEGTSANLRVGPFVILDELGRGPRATTFLAKSLERQDRCVVKRLRVPPEDVAECRRRLLALLERTADWSHPSLVVPHSMPAIGEQELAVVSRFVAGVPLSELLVRRGRFPASAVVEVARQLLDGLASLDGRGLVHGDIRLSNVRLTDRGLAVLIDGGVRPAVCPELTIHESFALEGYDGVAPELIGTGVTPNASTELYALGCLLWQLLAGRPPYPMADPLMKLAAHQTRRIEDVREWAPDTPALLALAILAMTSPRPEERPRSFDELLQRWGRPGAMSRSRLRRYRRTFDGAVPHLAQPTTSLTEGRWPWIAVSLFVAAGAALTFADKGLRNDLLALTNRVAEIVRPRESNHSAAASNDEATHARAASTMKSHDGLLPLPPPSADGEIVLAEAGPYDVADVATDGTLTIRGAAGVNPVIQVGREPLRLAADAVSLINVSVRREPRAGGAALPAMLLVRSRAVSIDRCEFELGPLDESVAPTEDTSAALAWLPPDVSPPETSNPTAGQFEVTNTTFRGHGAALVFADSPHRVKLINCLKVGHEPCFTLGSKATARAVRIELTRVTLRDSGPLLRFGGPFAEHATAPQIGIVAQDCVFALSSTVPSLIELQTARPRDNVAQSVHVTGQGSVVPLELRLLTVTDPSHGKPAVTVEADDLFEGLIASDLDFAGPASAEAGASELRHLSAPRSSNQAALPGVDPARLPIFRRE